MTNFGRNLMLMEWWCFDAGDCERLQGGCSWCTGCIWWVASGPESESTRQSKIQVWEANTLAWKDYLCQSSSFQKGIKIVSNRNSNYVIQHNVNTYNQSTAFISYICRLSFIVVAWQFVLCHFVCYLWHYCHVSVKWHCYTYMDYTLLLPTLADTDCIKCHADTVVAVTRYSLAVKNIHDLGHVNGHILHLYLL